MGEADSILDLSELLDLYKQDARENVARMRGCHARWEEIAANGAARDELRRLAHQLRGSGRTYGFREVTRVSKAIERIMDRLGEGRIDPGGEVRLSLKAKIERLAQIFGGEGGAR